MSAQNYSIFVQARMSSSRSPGKVAEDIHGKPMILRQLERLRNTNENINIVCVTSSDPSDDLIEEICVKNNFNCYRGSLENVLDRYIAAASFYEVDTIIRIGGDDPLVDGDQIEALITEYKDKQADFLFTSHKNGWPLGSAVELISVKSLNEIAKKTSDSLYLEHIIPWFHDNKENYRYIPVKSSSDVYRPNYYFTVDYPEDLALIKTIFGMLLTRGDFFPFSEVIKLCDENQSILDINKHLHDGFDLIE